MNKVAPISVCLIVKNEEAQIEDCLRSIRPHVAEICVVDTGSVDRTLEIVSKYADKFETYLDCNDSDGKIQSFSNARQRSFSLATQPWVMWIDGDDEVYGAEKLYDLVTNIKYNKNCMIMFPYEYSHDHNGNVTCYHYRERLVSPASHFEWQGAVHEVLVPIKPLDHLHESKECVIVHKRDLNLKPVEKNRNLRILKSNYDKVGDSDVRQLYYLGLEYGNINDIDNSIKFHEKYVALSGWDDEKCLSCMELARHYLSKGDTDSSLKWALLAHSTKDDWGEPLFAIGKCFYFKAQSQSDLRIQNELWTKCVRFIKKGLDLPPTKTILFVNPLDREYDIQKYYNFALNKLGKVEEALESVNRAISTVPDDQSLILNRKIYTTHLSKIKLNDPLNKLVEVGHLTKSDFNRILSIIEKESNDISVVTPVVKNVDVEKLVPLNDFTYKTDRKRDIVFFVGHSYEKWNPETVKEKGNGGSEIALIEMSTRLVSMGHSVRVYGDCYGLEGTFDGVQYTDYSNFANVECDIMISSRRPHIFDEHLGLKSKVNLCWVHDIHCGDELNYARSLKIDRFLTLSNWHKGFFLENYKYLHEDKVHVTKNGINFDRFNDKEFSEIKKNKNKAIYSSSPDRGLLSLLNVWGNVVDEVPDAELHVFYGFENWEMSAKLVNDQSQISYIGHLKNLLNNTKNVFYHGRVSQEILASHFMSASHWLYGTWFSETSCISAMEAQAAGLQIITSPVAALNETVGNRGTMIHGDWNSHEYNEKYKKAIIENLRNPISDDKRMNLINHARSNFSWNDVAISWDKELNSLVDEMSTIVIHPYKAILKR